MPGDGRVEIIAEVPRSIRTWAKELGVAAVFRSCGGVF